MGSLYGFEVKSELPLRRLNGATGTRGELEIEAAIEPLDAPPGRPVSRVDDEDGRCRYASYELDGGRCLLELPPTVNFAVEPDRRRILVDSRDEDAELLEHRIVSSAVCTLLAMRGDLVLHASAVQVEGSAVIFCGPSQRGKSTLARVLGEAGHPVIGEDGIAVSVEAESPAAWPGARGVRVRRRDRNGNTQTRVVPDPGPSEPEPCPVACVVLLGERGTELEATPLDRARALALLTPNLVHAGSRSSIGAGFGRLATLLHTTPALSVSLPDDLEALPAAIQRFLDSAVVRG